MAGIVNDAAATPQPQLPNPLTPMGWIAPDLAFQITIAVYLSVGILAVLVWDILNNLKMDYVMLTKHNIKMPTVSIATLAYILLVTIFETSPTGNCTVFEKFVDWSYPIAVSSTALLFFFRVRAIFHEHKAVIAFFAFMWLALLAGSLTPTQGITGGEIGTTEYCVNVGFKSYVAAAAVVPLVHDTLVFFAITTCLLTNFDFSIDDGVNRGNRGLRKLVFGEYMPAFSRALLQDGQVYYLTTVSTNLLTVIMLYVPSVPKVYGTMVSPLNAVLMNIMACRVFRNTKLGIFREPTMMSTIQLRERWRSRNKGVIPIAFAPNSQTQPQGPALTEAVVDEDEKGKEGVKSVQRLGDYNSSHVVDTGASG